MSGDLLFTFATRLRQIRISRGLSQEALADKVGLHRTYIGAIERCQKNITLRNVQKLASVLDVSVITLFLDDFSTNKEIRRKAGERHP